MAKGKIHGEKPGDAGNLSCTSCKGDEDDREKGTGRGSTTGTLGGGDEGEGIMKEVLEAKARGCEEFVSELQSTGEREIEEVVWDRRSGEFTG